MRGTITGLCSLSILAATVGCSGGVGNENVAATTQPLRAATFNQAGIAESFHTSGSIDRTNPFFQVFGTNGRSCATCHDSRAAWTMTPLLARLEFWETGGQGPLFRQLDETVRPDSDLSTLEARETAFAMLLKKGLTRFTRTIKPTAEFEVVSVDDPYGWSTPAAFSNFRRIIPTSNEAHQSSVTWTGGPADVRTNLKNVFVGGTKFHGETTLTVPDATAFAAADFLMGLSFAQIIDFGVGRLDVAGAMGGPANLSAQPFYLGINALGGDSKTGAAFDNESFDIYDAWETIKDKNRQRIGHGQHVFYTVDVPITGVPGINDALGQEVVHGHCTTCHNTPNVGSHSEFRMIDEGVATAERRTPDLPLVTLRNKTTGEMRQTTDVGRALTTGLWADISKVKVPTLRGVGGRAPYFHDGSADSLEDVLEFYEKRFGVDFGDEESREDVIAFMQSL